MELLIRGFKTPDIIYKIFSYIIDNKHIKKDIKKKLLKKALYLI